MTFEQLSWEDLAYSEGHEPEQVLLDTIRKEDLEDLLESTIDYLNDVRRSAEALGYVDIEMFTDVDGDFNVFGYLPDAS